MNDIKRSLVLVFSLLSTLLYAQDQPPLKVAVIAFQPPFIIQGGNNQLYGFDVSLMNNICKQIQRDCQYEMMPFEDILPTIQAKKADLAVSAISITANRSRIVSFSLPYLLSKSRFLAKTALSKEPFGLKFLQTKRIGIIGGTIFADQIAEMGVRNANIVPYRSVQEMINALNNDDIDLALLDNPSAKFWAMQSSGLLSTIGPALSYGFGYGIVLNKQDKDLLNAVNKALLVYQNSDAFKQNYNQYLK